MNSKIGFYLAMGQTLTGSRLLGDEKVRAEIPAKKCLQCLEYHYHNNSFCSAECCKKYRSAK